jgi:hypothetical protein
MDKLLILDDKTYILKDMLLTKDSGKAITRLCKKYKCIDGEIKQLQRATIFREGFVVSSVYVPKESWDKFEEELEAIGDGSRSGSNKNDFAKGKKQLEQHGLNELEKMKVEQNTRYPEYEAVAEKV